MTSNFYFKIAKQRNSKYPGISSIQEMQGKKVSHLVLISVIILEYATTVLRLLTYFPRRNFPTIQGWGVGGLLGLLLLSLGLEAFVCCALFFHRVCIDCYLREIGIEESELALT